MSKLQDSDKALLEILYLKGSYLTLLNLLKFIEADPTYTKEKIIGILQMFADKFKNDYMEREQELELENE